MGGGAPRRGWVAALLRKSGWGGAPPRRCPQPQRGFILPRRLLLTTALSLPLVAPLATSIAFAQDVPEEIATAKNQAVATINNDNVYVRSGGGDNYYPTTKLNKGAEVTIVGAERKSDV